MTDKILTKASPVAIQTQGRNQSLGVESQDMNLFPFDAFEFDDVNVVDYPVLTMKEPWSFGTSSIVQGQLDKFYDYLDTSMREQKINQDENEWALSQIKVGQNEIDIRVTATSDTVEGHSTAFVNLGVDPEGSSLTMGADKIALVGSDITVGDTMTVTDDGVVIDGSLTVGSDSASRSVNVGQAGLLVKDTGDTIIHDVIAQVASSDRNTMGHLYTLNGTSGTLLLSSTNPQTNTWTDVSALSGSGQNVKGVRLKVTGKSTSTSYDNGGVNYLFRPNGSAWSSSTGSPTPEVTAFASNIGGTTKYYSTVGIIDVPVTNGVFELYVNEVSSTLTHSLKIYKIGEWY